MLKITPKNLNYNNVEIIATKWDKLNQSDKVKCFKNFKTALNLEKDDFIKTSSEKKMDFDIVKDSLKILVKT